MKRRRAGGKKNRSTLCLLLRQPEGAGVLEAHSKGNPRMSVRIIQEKLESYHARSIQAETNAVKRKSRRKLCWRPWPGAISSKRRFSKAEPACGFCTVLSFFGRPGLYSATAGPLFFIRLLSFAIAHGVPGLWLRAGGSRRSRPGHRGEEALSQGPIDWQGALVPIQTSARHSDPHQD